MNTLLLEEVDSHCGDYIEAAATFSGKIVVTVANPYAGDTFTGIGREGSITLTNDQAHELGEFLVALSRS